MWSNISASLASVVGFVAIIYVVLYIFREKPKKLPDDIRYNYEGKVSSAKVNEMLDRNAYLHTLGPSYRGAMYGLHNDSRKRTSST